MPECWKEAETSMIVCDVLWSSFLCSETDYLFTHIVLELIEIIKMQWMSSIRDTITAKLYRN